VIGDLLARTDPPSYGAQIEKGATTLTEAWDANPDKSQNHLMLGTRRSGFTGRWRESAWIFPSPRRANPHPSPADPAGSWAAAEYQSIAGRIAVEWRRDGGRLSLSVEIPANRAASVRLPGRDVVEISSGAHHFECGIPIEFNGITK